MQLIHQFIADEVANGNTVLAYDRSVANPRVYHIKNMGRVAMVGNILHVDGVPAKGWTICRKP